MHITIKEQFLSKICISLSMLTFVGLNTSRNSFKVVGKIIYGAFNSSLKKSVEPVLKPANELK